MTRYNKALSDVSPLVRSAVEKGLGILQKRGNGEVILVFLPFERLSSVSGRDSFNRIKGKYLLKYWSMAHLNFYLKEISLLK